MSAINFHTKEISVKIVYYGPGLCGKTTSLQTIYASLPENKRPQLVSLATEVDRTIFFDFLPVTAYRIKDFNVRLQLYTVPGQVFYNATRKLVLNGADGIVFVVDSQRAARDSNLESLQNLQENLAELGLEIEHVPLVLQFNKRDLPDVLPVDEMDRLYNPRRVPSFPAVATSGAGIFDALKSISQQVVSDLMRKGLGRQLREQVEATASSKAADGAPDGFAAVGEVVRRVGEAAKQVTPGAKRPEPIAKPSAPAAAVAPAASSTSTGSVAAAAPAPAAAAAAAAAPAPAPAAAPAAAAAAAAATAAATAPAPAPAPAPVTPPRPSLWPPGDASTYGARIDAACAAARWNDVTLAVNELLLHEARRWAESAGDDYENFDPLPAFLLAKGASGARFGGLLRTIREAKGGRSVARAEAMSALVLALEVLW